MDIARILRTSRKARFSGRAFSVQSFLRLMGIDDAGGDGENWMIHCLNPAHEDAHPSFSLGKQGVFICYSCGVHGGLTDLFDLAGLSEEEIDQCFEDEGEDGAVHLRHPRHGDLLLPVGFKPCFQYINGQSHLTDNLLRFPDYLKKRGVTHEQAWRYGMGVCDDGYCAERVVVPIITSGKLLGWAARTMNGGKPKYLYPKGMKKSKALFGDDSWVNNGRHVVVCEGIMDALRIEQAGYHAAAVLGSQVSLYQAMLLRRCKKITIAPDNDEAGEKLVADLYSKLSGVPIFLASYDQPDPGDCPVEVLQQALAGAEQLA